MNELAVTVGIILFPGVIATIIADKIVVHIRPWGSLKYGLYSFILGVMCYVALQTAAWLQSFAPSSYQVFPTLHTPLDVWNIIADSKSRVNFWEVIGATIFAGPIALGATYLINHKVFIKIAKLFHVSIKYGDENLYSFYLNSNEVDWVYVRDFDRKLTYQGRVFSFSETDTAQELVLSDVTVYGYDNSDEYYSVPTIYLCRFRGSISIESVPTDILESDNGKEAAA